MDFSVIDFALVAKLLLLLLIGMGPKIALVPFLEKTKSFDAETQRAVGRRMVVTAVITALVLFAFGALLMRLLHITGGAVAVAGGIILAILAINMVSGPGKKVVEEIGVLEDPKASRGLPAGRAVSVESGRHHNLDHCVRRGRLSGKRRTCGWARPLGRGLRLLDLCQHRQIVKASKSHRSGYFRGGVRNSVDRGRRPIGGQRTRYARDHRCNPRRPLTVKRSL